MEECLRTAEVGEVDERFDNLKIPVSANVMIR
jgi:hypothetical protein